MGIPSVRYRVALLQLQLLEGRKRRRLSYLFSNLQCFLDCYVGGSCEHIPQSLQRPRVWVLV